MNECVDPMMELLIRIRNIYDNIHRTKSKSESEPLLISTRSARMEETSMNEIKSIKQYSKLISIELSGMNKVD